MPTPPPDHARARATASAVLSRYPALLACEELLPRICRDEGIEVLEADQQELAGVLRRRGDRWQVVLSRQDAPRRRLLTLAHLLGHYYLHAAPGRVFVEKMLPRG